MSDRELVWQIVFEARNHAEAGMVRGLLEGEGIVVMMRGRLGLPHLGSSEPALLLVPEQHAERAKELVHAFFSAPTVPETDAAGEADETDAAGEAQEADETDAAGEAEPQESDRPKES